MHEKFEDPALKAALRKACGKPSAPSELVNRLQALAHRESSAPSGPTMRIPWRAMAIAAALVVGLGLTWLVTRTSAEPVPPALMAGLCTTHDRCAGLANHHYVEAPTGDYAAIASALATKLNHPVIAADLGGGWNFKGAAVCKVAGNLCAHLVYKRQNEQLSVFSLPMGCGGGPDGTLYQTADASHPTAGFVQHGALFCVTGTSNQGRLPLKQVVAIRDTLRKVQPAVPSPIQTAAVDLLVTR